MATLGEQSSIPTTRQVVRACVRCRKQKSRCDTFRPCSVCVKAEAICQNRGVESEVEATRNSYNSNGRPRKIRRVRGRTETSHSLPIPTTENDSEKFTTDQNMESLDLSEQSLNTRLFTLTSRHCEQQQDMSRKNSDITLWFSSRPSTASLLRFLPPRSVADYLVAVYFNTVHWFVVVIHEGNFLHNYQEIMDLYARDEMLIPDGEESFTFALLVLTIVAMGGRYTSGHGARRRRCMQAFSRNDDSTEPPGLKSSDGQHFYISELVLRLFSVVHKNSTENLACGTLSTVQSMLLLGNLYCYHGRSNLALTQAACTFRVACALGIPREKSELCWTSPYYQTMDAMERHQLRCRLFWAVHTSDRFLAMCYGLSPFISDEDCVADIPRDDCAYPASRLSSFLMLDANQTGTGPGSTTLLTYQTHKLKFYIILGQILQTLYRRTTGGLGNILSEPPLPSSASVSTHGLQSKAEPIVNKIRQLDRALKDWYEALPPILRIDENTHYNDAKLNVCDGDDDIIIPGYDDRFQDSVHVQERRSRVQKSVYGIQALLLQVAYDHALILIHRHILTLKVNEYEMPPKAIRCWSMSNCWGAALRMSNTGWHHVFNSNQHTHAVSFVGVHLFAAGVVLAAFASSNLLSNWAVEAKKGLSRVIKMQRCLKDKALVSAQSLNILQNLAHEVMKKEEEAMIGEDPCHDSLQTGSKPQTNHTTIPDHSSTYEDPLSFECSVKHTGENVVLESTRDDDTGAKGDFSLPYDSFFESNGSMAEVDMILLNACAFQFSDFDGTFFTTQL